MWDKWESRPSFCSWTMGRFDLICTLILTSADRSCLSPAACRGCSCTARQCKWLPHWSRKAYGVLGWERLTGALTNWHHRWDVPRLWFARHGYPYVTLIHQDTCCYKTLHLCYAATRSPLESKQWGNHMLSRMDQISYQVSLAECHRNEAADISSGGLGR